MPVATVSECVADSASVDDILERYAGITPEQIKEVLKFVASSLEAAAFGRTPF